MPGRHGSKTDLRVGVYTDVPYVRNDGAVSTEVSYMRFPFALAPHVGELVVFGRLDPRQGEALYPLPDGVRFAPLPYYRSVFAVGELVQALPGSARAFARELPRLDAVLVYGPSPVAVLLAHLARLRHVPPVLVVRQDYPQYIGRRLPSAAWSWALLPAWALELENRRLARTTATVVTGAELARKYSSGAAPLWVSGLPVVSGADVVSLETALARSWDGDELRLVTVGRLDPEKNPLLLADVLAALRERDRRWTLHVIGNGPLERELRSRAEALGLGGALVLRGYVPNGPELWQLYREALAFLHVSFTEGLPQVLFEAQAAGLPIVATAVGGVGPALHDGELGLLVPPADHDAAAAALERLRDEPELRRRLVERSLESVETIEEHGERLLQLLGDVVSRAR